jgi:hypothetical protein
MMAIFFDFVGSQKSGESNLPAADHKGHPGWRISNIKKGIDSKGWLETFKPDVCTLVQTTFAMGIQLMH